jgi:hydrogenase-4 component F
MLFLLLAIPVVIGFGAFFLRTKALLYTLLVTGALAHSGVTALIWLDRPEAELRGWLQIDSAGLLFLSITSGLFLMAAIYGVGYLRDESRRYPAGHQALFVGGLLVFLATMSLACVTTNLGLLWVAIEGTTLASASLVYFHRSSRSLEATWKYLVLCSVGIALALLGNIFLGLAAFGTGQVHDLFLANLQKSAPHLMKTWLEAAFILMLVGYGTKMGLAPLHTWLPDAHSEAPAMVSCLLSGTLLNNAFLGILRGRQVCHAAGIGSFGSESLIALGLLSLLFAAAFIIRQGDYKRMLAYSSVEHMGLLAIGAGIGGPGLAAALFHSLNHSLSKGLLFLTAGNILEAYHSKSTAHVSGVRHLLPWTGFFWLAGFLAISGSPPFGTFLSEFWLAKTIFAQGRFGLGAAMIALLTVIFIGMAGPVLEMALGKPPEKVIERHPTESFWRVFPLLCLLAAGLFCGLLLPPEVRAFFTNTARELGG